MIMGLFADLGFSLIHMIDKYCGVYIQIGMSSYFSMNAKMKWLELCPDLFWSNLDVVVMDLIVMGSELWYLSDYFLFSFFVEAL